MKVNINTETGIRYGVIASNNVMYFWDEATPIYPDPVYTGPDDLDTDIDTDDNDYDNMSEPIRYEIDNNALQAHTFWDGVCIMITHSEYYTLTRLCSPCCPNAGDLDSPDDNGDKTYCLGHDFFGLDGAPYRVYRVADDAEVFNDIKGL